MLERKRQKERERQRETDRQRQRDKERQKERERNLPGENARKMRRRFFGCFQPFEN